MQQVAFLCRFHLAILKDVNFAIYVQIQELQEFVPRLSLTLFHMIGVFKDPRRTNTLIIF